MKWKDHSDFLIISNEIKRASNSLMLDIIYILFMHFDATLFHAAISPLLDSRTVTHATQRWTLVRRKVHKAAFPINYSSEQWGKIRMYFTSQ